MKAVALICSEKTTFSLEQVILPDPQDGDILVKTAYSGVSIGTEFALIHNKISWGPFPISTGYMATGVVEALGNGVVDVKVGDRVFVRGNRKMTLLDGTPVSPVSGTHCSYIVTQTGGTHGAGILPKGLSMETASMFVMPAVGYNGVNMSNPRIGESVVVFGCGQIGLGVVSASSLRGCHVIAVDVSDHALETAKTFGADATINSATKNVGEALAAICPDGADVVFECTGIPALIDQAMSLCRIDGKFIWQGNYGAKPIPFSFLTAHNRRLQTFYPCDDGYMPCRHAVLKQMARGVLPWEKTITHHVNAQDAPALFERINTGDKGISGATIKWA